MILLLLAPLLGRQPASADETPTHIERPGADWDTSPTVITMYCGATCSIDDEGETTPRMDFYHWNHGDNSNCGPCRTAAGLPGIAPGRAA